MCSSPGSQPLKVTKNVANIFVSALAIVTNMLSLRRQLNMFFDFMKYSEFYKLIESAGWTIKKGANHYKYVHPGFDYFIPVGRHPAKEIPKGTLDSMMKKAGLKK